jgi:multidrug efflux system outer membrane protein
MRAHRSGEGKAFRIAVVFFSLFFLCSPLFALTLDEAIAMALENNAPLKESALALEQASRSRQYAWNQFAPSVTGPQAGVTNTHGLIPQTSGGAESWGWSATMGASISFSADKLTQVKQLDAQMNAAVIAYDRTRRSLVVDVSKRFYTLLADNMNISLLEEDLAIKKMQHETVSASYGRGLASELDMLNAEYAYRMAIPALDNARTAYGESLAAFCLIIGADPASDPELEGAIETRTLTLPEGKELEAAYLPKRGDVQAALNSLNASELAVKMGSSRMAPSLSLSETLSYGSPQPGGITGSPELSGRLALTLTVPVNSWIPGLSDSVSRKNAESARQSAEIAYGAAQSDAAQDIRVKANAVQRYAAAADNVELNRRIASRAYELSGEGYKAGLVSQEDLQSANQRRLEAEQSAVTNRVGFINAAYDLALALGLGIEELYDIFGK